MTGHALDEPRILIVEDEYYLADEARSTLVEAGIIVIGPVPTATEATAVIESDPDIHAVLLDVNLRGEMAYEIADVLCERGIPFAFVTGYDACAFPERFAGVRSLQKPVRAAELVQLSADIARSTHHRG